MENVLENNKLIANVILGITNIVTEEQFLSWDYPNGEKYAKTNSHPKGMFVLESFDFHKDWNSLMVVALNIVKKHGIDCIAKRYSIEEIYNEVVLAVIYINENTGEGTKWARKCDITGQGMNSGWYDEGHNDINYIKNQKDAIEHTKKSIATDDSFKAELPTITDDRVLEIGYDFYGMYYTDWEDKDDYQFIEGKDGELIEIQE